MDLRLVLVLDQAKLYNERKKSELNVKSIADFLRISPYKYNTFNSQYQNPMYMAKDVFKVSFVLRVILEF